MKKTKLLINIFASLFMFVGLSSCDLFIKPSLSEPSETTYNTIAELYQNGQIGDLVSIKSTVSTIFDGGYILYDGNNHLGVYSTKIPEVEVGQVVQVTGEYAQYQSLFQIYPTNEVILNEEGVELPKAQPIDAAGVEAITTAKEECGKLYNMTVTVAWEKGETYENIELYMEGKRVGRVHYSSHVASYNALKVYAEARKTVNIDLVFYSYHSKDGKLFMFYGSDIKEVQ